MQYKITNGAVSYDGDMVLENINIEINDGEKIAIVGRNGCGKTTLLKAIMGEVELEEGTDEKEFRVIKTGSPSISYLRQVPFEDENITLLDEIRKEYSFLIDMEKELERLNQELSYNYDEKSISKYLALNDKFIALGGLTYEKEYIKMIRNFRFSDKDMQKPLSEFSGGQRTKILFIKMLLKKPDILILDEPTNHLDIKTIEWLETYLKEYKSTLIIVSHDRMFLNRIVNKVYEIEWGETRCYKGNYSAFEEQKQLNYEKQQKDHLAQAAEINRLTKLIERFRYKATKAKMVQSKIKLLERMQIIDAPDKYDTKTFCTKIQPQKQSSKQVLSVKNLEIGYESPLATVSFNLERGQKLAIIGGNGLGKSTLLKTLTNNIPCLSGNFEFGFNTQIAYFDQQTVEVSGDIPIFDIFSNAYPHLSDTEVRSALGAFQFSGEDVFRYASTLSGGEKVRLTLCKILYSRPNVLILDEPTNHMDIIGKKTLEDILLNFRGTIIFVSHDRYFVNKIANCLLVFDGNDTKFYHLTYSEYEEKKKNESTDQNKDMLKSPVDSKPEKVKRYSPQKEIDKRKKRLEKLELFISQCQEEIDSLNKQMESPDVYSDYKQIAELEQKINLIKEQLKDYEDEWFIISEYLENFTVK